MSISERDYAQFIVVAGNEQQHGSRIANLNARQKKTTPAGVVFIVR
jgi:hypothetical protein